MIRLFRFLITGDWHQHKWKIIETVRCRGDFGNEWTRRYCQCDHCGTIKVFDA